VRYIGFHVNRLGELGYNSFGTPMKIIRFYLSNDMTIEFQDEHKVKVETTYCNFNRGSIKNPYDKSVFKAGYYGVGKYVAKQNYALTTAYVSWKHILERCYDEPQKHKHLAYYGITTVCEEWLNYQNYAEWYYKNYYEIDNKRMHIDKDILVKYNKIYSPETCIFVPQRINMLFVEKPNKWNLPNGISMSKSGKYITGYNTKHIGNFNTLEEAIFSYDNEKRPIIRAIADEYKNMGIPLKLYEALYRW